MTVTIASVPDSLTRQELVEWLASVGIVAEDCIDVVIDRDGIRATVYARNADGKKYGEANAGRLAQHVIHIRIDD